MRVVAAIIIYDGHLVAFKRRYSEDKSISKKYEFPGGKVKKNESDLQALKREIKEELNIKLIGVQFFCKAKHQYVDKTINLICYICKIENLKFELKVHIGFKLLNKYNVLSEDWLAADYSILRALIEKKII